MDGSSMLSRKGKKRERDWLRGEECFYCRATWEELLQALNIGAELGSPLSPRAQVTHCTQACANVVQ